MKTNCKLNKNKLIDNVYKLRSKAMPQSLRVLLDSDLSGIICCSVLTVHDNESLKCIQIESFLRIFCL